jgi:hypothetical protein
MAMLATCLQLSLGSATLATATEISNLTESQATWTDSDNSRFDNYSKYEPDPNGNPKTDGTGTR